MEKKTFILKHVPNEGAGTFLGFLDAKRLPCEEIALYENQSLPPVDEVRAVLVMGGPMNVDEEKKYPFLKPETEFIRELALRDIPTIGICLGAQLIAKALGKKVYKAPTPEIGWSHVQILPEAQNDPLFSSLQAKNLLVLQWHEDTFDLPEGATLLATNPDVCNQAYRYKKNIYGFQFHLEVTRPMLEDWFAKRQGLPEILKTYESYRQELESIVRSFCEGFFIYRRQE